MPVEPNAQDLSQLVDSVTRFTEHGTAAFIVGFFIVLIVALLVAYVAIKGYNRRADKATDNETKQAEFNQQLYIDLKESFKRIADTSEALGASQATNVENQAKTAKTLDSVVEKLEKIGTDVHQYPKLIEGTLSLNVTKLDTILQLVTLATTKPLPVHDEILALLREGVRLSALIAQKLEVEITPSLPSPEKPEKQESDPL